MSTGDDRSRWTRGGKPWRLVVLCVVLVAQLVTLAVILSSKPNQAAALDALYKPPAPLPAHAPGTPLRVWKLDTTEIHGDVYGILYHSRSVAGADILVSGYIAVPQSPAPAGGRPIVSLGHGTVGSADRCAVSRDPSPDAPTINPFLDRGWIVVATDYEGIGGAGPHPYLVGESEARSMIDAVRAVRRLMGSAAGNRFIAWGISQGGHAALFARQDVAKWAPELQMVGAVAMAPVSDVTAFADSPTIAPQAITLLLAAGYSNVYPELHPDQVLSAAGMAGLARVDQLCLVPLNDSLATQSLATMRRSPPGALTAWRQAFERNTPGQVASSVPVLIVQGDRDPIVPPATSEALFRQLCTNSPGAQYDLVPGASHGDIVSFSRATYLAWMQARLDGQAAPTNCAAQL